MPWRSIGTNVRRRTSIGSPTSTSDCETATTTSLAARTSAARARLPDQETSAQQDANSNSLHDDDGNRSFSPGSDSWLPRAVLPARCHRWLAAGRRLDPRRLR